MKDQTRNYLGNLLDKALNNAFQKTANALLEINKAENEKVLILTKGRAGDIDSLMQAFEFLPANEIKAIRAEVDKLESQDEPQLRKEPAQKIQMPNK